MSAELELALQRLNEMEAAQRSLERPDTGAEHDPPVEPVLQDHSAITAIDDTTGMGEPEVENNLGGQHGMIEEDTAEIDLCDEYDIVDDHSDGIVEDHSVFIEDTNDTGEPPLRAICTPPQLSHNEEVMISHGGKFHPVTIREIMTDAVEVEWCVRGATNYAPFIVPRSDVMQRPRVTVGHLYSGGGIASYGATVAGAKVKFAVDNEDFMAMQFGENQEFLGGTSFARLDLCEERNAKIVADLIERDETNTLLIDPPCNKVTLIVNMNKGKRNRNKNAPTKHARKRMKAAVAPQIGSNPISVGQMRALRVGDSVDAKGGDCGRWASGTVKSVDRGGISITFKGFKAIHNIQLKWASHARISIRVVPPPHAPPPPVAQGLQVPSAADNCKDDDNFREFAAIIPILNLVRLGHPLPPSISISLLL